MRVTIRRYGTNDIELILDLVDNFLYKERQGTINHFYTITFDRDKLRDILTRREADKDFFCSIVISEDGKLLGILAGSVAELLGSRDKTASDWLLYMQPDFANLRVLIRLITTFVTWAKSRGAYEVHLCNSSGYKQEKFAKLMKLVGFDQFMVGYAKRI